MDAFLSGFAVILSPYYMGFMIIGVSVGLMVGFLPGLTGGIGIGLMLPFTFGMDPLAALVFLMSIFTGNLFGGAVTAIIFNTPGSPANVATVLDGYPMHKAGDTERAMGLALMSSFLGGLIGAACLLFLAGPMAMFALRFGPGEMFMVAIFGLSVVGSLSDNILKSLFAGTFGLLLGTVGITAAGVTRGTFGSNLLLDGIPMIPALIGFLALPEIYELAGRKITQSKDVAKISSGKGSFIKLLKSLAETLLHIPRAIVSSFIGVIVGLMPAAGAAVAALLAYNQNKQWSRNPERWGTGIPEGIIAPETANSTSAGGALATTFVLGIPGSPSAAMILGALVLQGWVPGPRMFITHSDIIYISFSSLFVQQFVLLFLGIILCMVATKIVRLPIEFLMPAMAAFTMLGAFSNRSLLFDVYLMLFFSVISWIMKRNGFPIMPIILGLLLGPIADVELMRIHQLHDSFWHIFRSPIVVVLALISLICVMLPAMVRYRNRRRISTQI